MDPVDPVDPVDAVDLVDTAHRPAAPDRPVFIVGCPRSGTTLLQLMLHAHPRIAIPPETRFVVQAYRARHQFGVLSVEENRRGLANWIVKRPMFKDLGLDRDDVRRAVVAAPPTIGSAVGTVLAMYAARHGRVRWGDKRPDYWRDIDVVLRLFPDAQFIHIVRDGRACVASLKRMRWWGGGVPAAIVVWLMAQRRCRRDTRHLPEGSFHELRYEDLVSDPEAELRRLCVFLGEEFSPAMLAPHKVAEYAVPTWKTWHTRTADAVDTATVESWREGLEPKELALVEFVAGRSLKANGYRLSGAGGRPSAGLLLRFARECVRREGYLWKKRLRDRRMRRDERTSVAARLTSGQQAAGTPTTKAAARR
ncbi:MAG: sulfotransferase family protein [Streptomycetales bacterium]